MGNSGDIEAETLALLLEHEVDYGPFPESVISDDLPSLPWTIPPEELKRRRDYRCESYLFIFSPLFLILISNFIFVGMIVFLRSIQGNKAV